MILKIPFELAILDSTKRGTKLAPEAISKELDLEFKEVQTLGDFEQTQDNIIKAAKNIYPKRCIAIGGDHSITYGLVKAFSQAFEGKLGLLYIDAHLDAEDDFLPPSHEDIMRAIVNKKLIAPENILIIGARKLYSKDLEFAKKHNLKYSRNIDTQQIQELINRCDHVYVSLDIDALDPKFAPGTGHPELDGLTEEQVLELASSLASSPKVKGFDLVEVSPPRDIDKKTVKLATKLIKLFTTPKA